ncbi:mitogen-activated protein kinase kinase kinase YODA-like [Prunus yedoensis var. nudiflora]|uniref:Mitogen-activated protein kinase kinase kinase YODA-like n=1 Tax=Prunus yedoensis var. nudiflora TaxID=2094558 RepID=A0A314YZM0_PRUYE|nr:mitogen-activated protein kinase kinase kinase YODA-like [Prunus yedoensis var. nudiflora]
MGSLKQKREILKEDEPWLVEKSFLVTGREWVRGRILGQGGFGSVYLASVKKPKLDSEGFPAIMAVKSALMAKSPELVSERSLLGEFRGCPFVIDCYGEDFTAGIGYNLVYNVFLEYADGGTIGNLIKQSGASGLCELQVRKYTESILKGIQYIHERGFVHCDLKPENILLVTSGSGFVPKIGDLGLAKRAAGEPFKEKPSDIWALLGCVVLKMLTGRHPWDAKAGVKLHDLKPLIASGVPKVPGGLSEDARDFLKNCFARNPSQRLTAAKLLDHPFVTKVDEIAQVKAEPIKEVSSVSSSSNCGLDYGSFIPLGSWSSENAEEMEQQILPLAIMYPRDSRPVIPNTGCQKPSAFAIMGAA